MVSRKHYYHSIQRQSRCKDHNYVLDTISAALMLMMSVLTFMIMMMILIMILMLILTMILVMILTIVGAGTEDRSQEGPSSYLG